MRTTFLPAAIAFLLVATSSLCAVEPVDRDPIPEARRVLDYLAGGYTVYEFGVYESLPKTVGTKQQGE